MFGIILGLFVIALGMKAFTPKGLPLTRRKDITGKSAKAIGVVCILLGVVLICDGVFASFSIIRLFSGRLPFTHALDLSSSGLIGTWDVNTKEVLPNGHYVVARNLDTYRKDGTFNEDSQMNLMDGVTHQPFITMRTKSSGTWTLMQGEMCRTYLNASLVEFESKLPDRTRDQMASQIQEDLVKSEPQCYAIVSATPNQVILRAGQTNAEMILKRGTQ